MPNKAEDTLEKQMYSIIFSSKYLLKVVSYWKKQPRDVLESDEWLPRNPLREKDHIQILMVNNMAEKGTSVGYHSMPGPAVLQLGWPKVTDGPCPWKSDTQGRWTGNFPNRREKSAVFLFFILK